MSEKPGAACPWCGGPLESGTLASRTAWTKWYPDNGRTWLQRFFSLGGEILPGEFPAWRCKRCKKIVLDYSE